MNKIPNRKAMSDTLLRLAKENRDIIVLTSDSRGSALLGEFGEKLPEQLVEVGIAEQNLVGVAAGLAHGGKRTFAVSPASFLSMRSIEQIKVDVAYSNTNVKLVGISGGVSYGALGMSHHSLQDIAVTRAIPNLQVIIPADRFETEKLFEELVKTNKPAYIRLGRNAVQDCYENNDFEFVIGKANVMLEGEDVTIFATGETVRIAMDASIELKSKGVTAAVVNMHTLKPLDTECILRQTKTTKLFISVEEHSIYGGLGSAIAEVISPIGGVKHHIIGLPDEPPVTGNSQEVFEHYGITPNAISEYVLKVLRE